MKRALQFVVSPVALSLFMGTVIAASSLHISTADAQVQNYNSSSPSQCNAKSNARPQSWNSQGTPNLTNSPSSSINNVFNAYLKCVAGCRDIFTNSEQINKCIEGCAKIHDSIKQPQSPGTTRE